MSGTYELWDVETGNSIGAFGDEAAALAAVRETWRAPGRLAVQSLALGREDERGEFTAIAKGDELIARVEALVP